jgi:hypothetical protein
MTPGCVRARTFVTALQFFLSADTPAFVADECCGGDDAYAQLPLVECDDYCFYTSIRMFDKQSPTSMCAPTHTLHGYDTATLSWGVWRGCHAHLNWLPMARANETGLNCYAANSDRRISSDEMLQERRAQLRNRRDHTTRLNGENVKQVIQVRVCAPHVQVRADVHVCDGRVRRFVGVTVFLSHDDHRRRQHDGRTSHT